MASSDKPAVENDTKDSQSPPQELFVNICLVGDRRVGKTSIMYRFGKNTYYPNLVNHTIGTDFMLKTAEIDGRVVKIRVWDVPGNIIDAGLTRTFLRNAHGVALIFDVTSQDWSDSIRKWNSQAIEHGPDSVARIIIGHKADDYSRRAVEPDRAAAFAAELNLRYFECSSLSGANVELAIMELAREVLQSTDPATLVQRPGVPLQGPLFEPPDERCCTLS